MNVNMQARREGFRVLDGQSALACQLSFRRVTLPQHGPYPQDSQACQKC